MHGLPRAQLGRCPPKMRQLASLIGLLEEFMLLPPLVGFVQLVVIDANTWMHLVHLCPLQELLPNLHHGRMVVREEFAGGVQTAPC